MGFWLCDGLPLKLLSFFVTRHLRDSRWVKIDLFRDLFWGIWTVLVLEKVLL